MTIQNMNGTISETNPLHVNVVAGGGSGGTTADKENPFNTKFGQEVVSIEESFWHRLMRKGRYITKLSPVAGDAITQSASAFSFPLQVAPDNGFRLYPRTITLSCSEDALLSVQIKLGLFNDPQNTPGVVQYQAFVAAKTPWVLNFEGEVYVDGNAVNGPGIYVGAQTNTAGALLWGSIVGIEVTYNA